MAAAVRQDRPDCAPRRRPASRESTTMSTGTNKSRGGTVRDDEVLRFGD
jgi:hypothetical protein